MIGEADLGTSSTPLVRDARLGLLYYSPSSIHQTMTNQKTMDPFHHASPHFVLVPLMAQGHMIPMLDMACRLADHGALVSFITTPFNAQRIKPTIDRVKHSQLAIRFVEIPFPSSQVGLPEGCENVDLIESIDFIKPFFEVTRLLAEPLKLYLQEQPQGPTCMISDFSLPWTAELARKLNIPRLVFHGPSCFYLLCVHNIRKHRISDRITDPFEPFLVPDLPRQQSVVITRVQSPGIFEIPGWEKFRADALESEAAAEGVILNSFEELEDCFIESYRKVMGNKVWTIGPLCLLKDNSYMATGGNKAVVEQHQVLTWLDPMRRGSVIYVNFGSLARNSDSQLMEIGLGLEASNRPFIWVIKERENSSEVNKWLSEGFEERTRERGLVIKGWVPQRMILSHPAVGGFVTHCGWNSALEAISAGLPMITWPHFIDQFLNEKLIVEVLRIGVPVGVKMPTYHLTRDECSEQVLVKRDDVEKAVVSLLDEGDEGKKRKERVSILGVKAREAMEEGGSSYKNLTHLIQYVMEHQNKGL